MKIDTGQLSIFDFNEPTHGKVIATSHTFPCSACIKDGEQCSLNYATSGKFCENFKTDVDEVLEQFVNVIMVSKLPNPLLLSGDFKTIQETLRQKMGMGGSSPTAMLNTRIKGYEFDYYGHKKNEFKLRYISNGEKEVTYLWSDVEKQLNKSIADGTIKPIEYEEFTPSTRYYYVSWSGKVYRTENYSYLNMNDAENRALFKRLKKVYEARKEIGNARAENTYTEEEIQDLRDKDLNLVIDMKDVRL